MKAKFFMLLPVVLLALSFAGWGVMMTLATSDRTFAVEADYYQKAARFEEELAQRKRNRELGWRIEAVDFHDGDGGALTLRARVLDRDGLPVSAAEVDVLGISNLRAGEAHTASAVTDAVGQITAELTPGPGGLWELRFSVRRGSAQFSQVVRTDVRPKSKGGPS